MLIAIRVQNVYYLHSLHLTDTALLFFISLNLFVMRSCYYFHEAQMFEVRTKVGFLYCRCVHEIVWFEYLLLVPANICGHHKRIFMMTTKEVEKFS